MNNMDRNQIISEAQFRDYSKYYGGTYEIHAVEEIMQKWLQVEFINEYEPPKFLYKNKEFHIRYAKAHKNHAIFYDAFLWGSPNSFFKDLEFAKKIVEVHPSLCYYFDSKLRTNKEFILTTLKAIDIDPADDHQCFMRRYLYVDNRITAAYEICKLFPEYECMFGAALRRKLNGQNIVKYVETRNLFKILNKEVPKRVEVTKRKKI